MFLSHRIPACAVVLFASFAIYAQQQPCNLKLGQLPQVPEFYGFRLGMTREEIKARTPLIRFGKTDQFGVTKTSINPSFDPRFDQAAYAGVRTISLDFLDDRLVTLWIGYDDRFKWQTIDDFISGIRKSLNISQEFIPKRAGRELVCQDFSLFVSIIARSPSLRITDNRAEDTIAARREEAAAVIEAAVVGDKSTGLYYPSDCAAAEKISAANRVTFQNKEDGEKAGYKPAKDCQ